MWVTVDLLAQPRFKTSVCFGKPAKVAYTTNWTLVWNKRLDFVSIYGQCDYYVYTSFGLDTHTST